MSPYHRMPTTATEVDHIVVGKSMARAGYGHEDVRHVTGLPELKCRLIVGVHGGKHGDDRFASEVDQYEANARLIAAAPDLAEALAEALVVLENVHERENDNDCRWDEHTEKHCPGTCGDAGCIRDKIIAARAALSRAKGETT